MERVYKGESCGKGGEMGRERERGKVRDGKREEGRRERERECKQEHFLQKAREG